jgi:hypothetical protein
VSVARLLAENVAVLLVGLGLIPVFGLASTPARLRELSGLAYLTGLAAVGILAAGLASISVPFPPLALVVLALVSLVAGIARIDRRAAVRPGSRTGGLDRTASLVFAPLLAAAAVVAFVCLVEKPLHEWDGWAIWGLKAHAIASLGSSSGDVLGSQAYYFSHLEYPLLLPGLDALGIRAAGGYESRLVVIQNVLLGVAGLLALWGLLRDRVRPVVLWPALAALATAPTVLSQLASGYADLPTALFVAAGLVAGARWLLDSRPPWLVLTVLFLAAAALTKDEGGLFAAAAIAGLLLAAAGRRLQVLAAAAAGACVLLPWRVFVAVHDFSTSDFSLWNSFDPGWLAGHVGRAPGAANALVRHALYVERYGLLVPLGVVGILAAVAMRAWSLTIYVTTFAVVSLLGLVWVYVVSAKPLAFYLSQTQDRITASIVLACAAVAPLLATVIDPGVRSTLAVGASRT